MESKKEKIWKEKEMISPAIREFNRKIWNEKRKLRNTLSRGRVGGETAASVVCLSAVGGWVRRQLSNRVSRSPPACERPIGFAASGCGSLISIDWYYQPVLTYVFLFIAFKCFLSSLLVLILMHIRIQIHIPLHIRVMVGTLIYYIDMVNITYIQFMYI